MADGIKAGEIIIFELIIILESSLHESEENNDLLEVTIKETIVRIMIIFKIGYFCQNIFSDRLLSLSTMKWQTELKQVKL